MSIQQTVRLISLVASGALAARRFVTTNGSAEAAYPSAQGEVSGVTQEAADAQGKVIGVALPDGALVKVEAGAAVAVGNDVATDATGRVIPVGTADGDQKVGRAFEAASAAGEIITIQFMNRGQINA